MARVPVWVARVLLALVPHGAPDGHPQQRVDHSVPVVSIHIYLFHTYLRYLQYLHYFTVSTVSIVLLFAVLIVVEAIVEAGVRDAAAGEGLGG